MVDYGRTFFLSSLHYLLFSSHFSLSLSFSLLFPLEDFIKEYYHHTEEETKDYEPCTTVFNPRITKHCDLRAREWKNGVACGLAEGILSGVFCFEMETEGVVGGFYRRAVCKAVLEVSGGDGAGDTRQQTRQGEGGRVPAMMVVAGALQKGGVGSGSAHGGGALVHGARVSGGVNDPNVCGLWFQESLPLYMVITPSVLFSCLLGFRGSALILMVGPFD
jgi:hypothetical protein